MPTDAHVLILGGTSEARALAARLHGRPHLIVTSSLAGRVVDPVLPVGDVRSGGFGGVEGLTRWITDHGVDHLVDATHPFASTMTAHAAQAARATGVPLTVVRRPPWTPGPDDRWRRVPTMTAAAEAIAPNGRALLTIGRQGVHHFAHRDDVTFVVRCIDPPDGPVPAATEVLRARGPFALEGERQLLADRRIDTLVSKNSGGALTEPKLVAAREAGVAVIMIDRPPLPDGLEAVASVDGAIERIRSRTDAR